MGKKPKGYWIETAPNGEKLYCHKVRRNGKTMTIRKSLCELAEILKSKTKIA
jgi:hypothetical protein